MASESRSNITYGFSGHQTFPFGYPWLPKGVRYLQEYPDLTGSLRRGSCIAEAYAQRVCGFTPS